MVGAADLEEWRCAESSTTFSRTALEHYLRQNLFSLTMISFLKRKSIYQIFFETVINRELVQQLLSYGCDVEVIEPIELTEKLKEQIKSMQDFYY